MVAVWIWVDDRWLRRGVVLMVAAWVWVDGFGVVCDGGII